MWDLTHRQKYDWYHVSSDISDTNTEILTAIMSQCNLGYSTFIFTGWNSSFFLVLASSKSNRHCGCLGMQHWDNCILECAQNLFWQSLCSISTSFESTYIPVSVIHLCMNKHSFRWFLLYILEQIVVQVVCSSSQVTYTDCWYECCHRRLFHHVIKILTWQPSSKPKAARQKIISSYRTDIHTHNFK